MGPLPCVLETLTPPMAAGTYPVHVLYGWAPTEPPPDEARAAGEFTYVPSDEMIGHGSCTRDLECDTSWEYCDLGLGRCVPDLCRSLICPAGTEYCDPLLGCRPQSQACQTGADCKLLYSSCGCQAVPRIFPASRSVVRLCASSNTGNGISRSRWISRGFMSSSERNVAATRAACSGVETW